MQTIRSLLALLLLSPIVMAQAPVTKPGATIELQLVTLSDEGFAKFTLDYQLFVDKGVPTKAIQFMDQAGLKKLMGALEGQRSVRILQAPKMVLSDGRTGSVTYDQAYKFMTGLELKTVEGKNVVIPKNETFVEGLTASVCPKIAADRSHITFKLDLKNTIIDPNVPLTPVTWMVEPTYEGGSKGQPIPVTQFIQKPIVDTITYETTFILPNLAGACVHLGKQSVQTRKESAVPVMSQIPYLSRLFKNVGLSTEPQHVLLIVTAAVTDVPVAGEYVADYRKAISEGRLDEAKALAAKALTADPACFVK